MQQAFVQATKWKRKIIIAERIEAANNNNSSNELWGESESGADDDGSCVLLWSQIYKSLGTDFSDFISPSLRALFAASALPMRAMQCSLCPIDSIRKWKEIESEHSLFSAVRLWYFFECAREITFFPHWLQCAAAARLSHLRLWLQPSPSSYVASRLEMRWLEALFHILETRLNDFSVFCVELSCELRIRKRALS